MIDLYCERTGPGLLAEPLNALSNASFFVAAFLAWREARATKALSPGLLVLIILAAGVGTGSLLFHTFATRWGMILDVTFIGLFQVAFLWLYLRGPARWPLPLAVGGVIGFLGLNTAAGMLPPLLNGSLSYAPGVPRPPRAGRLPFGKATARTLAGARSRGHVFRLPRLSHA